MIRISISSDALSDLEGGFRFYERQQPDLGEYFATQLRADIDALKVTAGIHREVYRGLHRVLSHRFPFGIFYRFTGDRVEVVAVIDCRRDPEWMKEQLRNS